MNRSGSCSARWVRHDQLSRNERKGNMNHAVFSSMSTNEKMKITGLFSPIAISPCCKAVVGHDR